MMQDVIGEIQSDLLLSIWQDLGADAWIAQDFFNTHVHWPLFDISDSISEAFND